MTAIDNLAPLITVGFLFVVGLWILFKVLNSDAFARARGRGRQ